MHTPRQTKAGNWQLISSLLTTILLSITTINAAQKTDKVFFASELTIPQGTTCAIPIRITPAQKEKLTTEPANIIKIIRQPVNIQNNSLSFAQLKAVHTGTTTLTTENGSKCEITVTPPQTDVMQKLRQPKIFSPVINSYVWGTFSVGVELMADDISYDYLSKNIKLTTPAGKPISPSSITEENTGPMYIVNFNVDADKLPQQINNFTVSITMPDKSVRKSNSLQIYKITPATKDIFKGECENHINDARPKQFNKNKRKQKIKSVASASGGQYVANSSPDPTWTLAFDAKESGLYQLFIRARGDIAANTYPTIGLYVNEHNRPIRNVRLTDNNWQRLPVGTPLRLEAGNQILSLRFENDFYVRSKADRNLYLDAFEILKIPDNSIAENIQLRLVNPITDPLVTGEITLRGECRWNNPISNAVPAITLIINNQQVATQYSPRPIFKVKQNQLKLGNNIISLSAASGNKTISITPDYNILTKNKITAKNRGNNYYRFSVLDPSWNGTLDKIISNDDKKKFREQAGFFSSHNGVLTLPDALAGKFRLSIEAQGQAFEGKPIATITINQSGTNAQQRDFPVDSWMHTHRAANINLTKGPKTLSVTFTNDYYIADKGDRNFNLRAIILSKKDPATDKAPPVATITYPKPGHTAYQADVVVAECYDNTSLQSTELIIDNKPTGIKLTPYNGLGRLVFPLSCRNLTPGKHSLQISVRDINGNKSKSSTIEINVTNKQPTKPTTYARAIHILNRFAFGNNQADLADILTLGETEWIEQQLTKATYPALNAALARYPVLDSNYQTVMRALQYMITSDNTVQTRLSLWIQNHFSTWLNKTGASAKWNEYKNFVEAGPATFSELLTLSATSPAMLIYLDQQKSFAENLNENYAREIMELHTLGVDHGYTQQDVTELARILTGWTTVAESNIQGMGVRQNHTFRQSPSLNDKENKEFLGIEFKSPKPQKSMEETIWAMQILAAHPETAKHIARQLAEYYVSMPAPNDLVNKLALEYMKTNGSLSAMLKAIITSKQFMATATTARLSTPIDYGLHFARLMKNQPAGDIRNFLLDSGMGLFDRVTPDGYPNNDAAYADSNALLQRWKLATRINKHLKYLVPRNLQTPPKKNRDQWAQQLTDILAIRLTGNLLSKQSNQAMLDLLLIKNKKNTDPTSKAIAFICQLPEANLK